MGKFFTGGKLGQMYEQFRDDPELMSLADSIAQYNALIAGKWEELCNARGMSTEWYTELQDAWDAVESNRSNPQAMAEAMNTLRDLIREGAAIPQILDDWQNLTQNKARLNVVEAKRMEAEGLVLNVQQSEALIMMVLSAVTRNVSKRAEIDAIATELEGFLAPTVGPRLTHVSRNGDGGGGK